MGEPTRWATDTGAGHSRWYVDRFRRMAAEGADLAGEARLLDALVPPGARILDAGCGQGRVGAALAERGHTVVGVDADPVLIEAARTDHPGPTWLVADLAELDLPGAPFDAAVLAGNVMTFVAPDTERQVLRQVAAQLRTDGVLVIGFGTDRGYPLADFDADTAAVGLHREHRFATWDLRPWRADADFAVTVLRRPADGVHPTGAAGS
ncbi:class I SAM-dependent methyltransferase [Micromonospora cathayae]|uniref:Class I SAM-dependent methyltransferase n=1 Tax=Micromonospora cathayae TaxID=3028804 RepID=A0ABY7ZHK1_9ACTN|nr:class I SAM-dependent methyltransferase [Micromonospora sp. HUAS 3]WDZ82462.1 class I SAM-dependent methyltransferase [Micromonospora sp. HUAS 3]